MILVTVGTHDKGFERLVRAADELAAQVLEEVVIQFGSSQYIPMNAKCFRWASSEQMERLTGEARIVVTHAAAGAIILALLMGKPLVVVPRAWRYGEHIDDHQEQLAAALNASNQAIQVPDPTFSSLKDAVERCVLLDAAPRSNYDLVLKLKQQLKDWDQTKPPWLGWQARNT
jgi:UDP-N-acetylglucosamine transferase subunit ALG13